MSPRHPDHDPLPRPSRRAIVLGSAGVLAAAIVMGALGFTAALPGQAVPAHAAVSPSPHVAGDQLQTLSLTEVRGHEPLGRR